MIKYIFLSTKMQEPLSKQAKHKLFFFFTIEGKFGYKHLTLEVPKPCCNIEITYRELIDLDASPYTIKYKSLGPEPGISSH